MNKRLKEVRLSQPSKMSQEKFAEVLGTTRNAYKAYELGLVVPSDTFIKLLCTKFNVSEEWLRTGKGNMLHDETTSAMEQLKTTYNLDDTERTLLNAYLHLKPKYREMFREFAKELLKSQENGGNKEAPKEVEPPKEQTYTVELNADELDALARFRKGVSELSTKNSPLNDSATQHLIHHG